jgi:hypothetical protein
MKKKALLFLLFINLSCGCNEEKKSEIEYIQKQGYVNSVDVIFDFNRNKKIDILITVLFDENKHVKFKIKNSDFICQIGDPIIVMINPNDSNDIWILGKHIIDDVNLKKFLNKNQLKLSPFFVNKLK